MSYYHKLSKEILREYQKKAQVVIQERHLQRCKEAATIYLTHNDINLVCEKLKVKKRQAYKLIEKGKNYV